MICCYILHSKIKDRYYTGICQDDLSKRIEKHNTHSYKGQHYTDMASDWELFLMIECQTISQSLKIEKHIKRMKSRVFIENLKRHVELQEKLLLRYAG